MKFSLWGSDKMQLRKMTTLMLDMELALVCQIGEIIC